MEAKTLVALGLVALCAIAALPAAEAHYTVSQDVDGDGQCETTTIPEPTGQLGHGQIWTEGCGP